MLLVALPGSGKFFVTQKVLQELSLGTLLASSTDPVSILEWTQDGPELPCGSKEASCLLS